MKIRPPTTAESQLDQNCHWLTRHALLCAADQVHRRRWRGAFGGLLPDGYDPQSIAAEACAQLLTTHHAQLELPLDPPLQHQLLHQLHWLVRKHIDRLHHRKENSLLVNEADLTPVLTQDGEPMSVVEAIPAPFSPSTQALQLGEEDRQHKQFDAFLAKERRLQAIWRCQRAGLSTPKALARKLHLNTRTIRNLRQRLQRRWQEFLQTQSSAKNDHATPKNTPSDACASTPYRDALAKPCPQTRQFAASPPNIIERSCDLSGAAPNVPPFTNNQTAPNHQAYE